MRNQRLIVLSLALIGGAATATLAQAQSQDAGLSRAQVVAELQAAQAAGTVPHGDLDATRNAGTDTHPARGATSSASRAQVLAELAQAIRNGDIVVGDNDRTLAELDPSHYPLPVPQRGLTRAEVRSQLAEAIRVGDMPFGDEGKTMAEEFPQRYAAARAQEVRDQQTRYAAALSKAAATLAAETPAPTASASQVAAR